MKFPFKRTKLKDFYLKLIKEISIPLLFYRNNKEKYSGDGRIENRAKTPVFNEKCE